MSPEIREVLAALERLPAHTLQAVADSVAATPVRSVAEHGLVSDLRYWIDQLAKEKARNATR